MEETIYRITNMMRTAIRTASARKRAGFGLLGATIAAAAIVGLTAYGYARFYSSGNSHATSSRNALLVQNYLNSAIEAVRRQKYEELDQLAKNRQPIGQTGYTETISIGQESQGRNGNLSRNVDVRIFFGDEQTPRLQSSVERTNYSHLAGNLYDGPGNNADAPMTSRSAYETYASKNDSVRYSGQQVGDINRPVYLNANGTVQSVDFFYRGNYNKTANKLLTYTGNFIDYISKDWVNSNGSIAEEKHDADSGFIRYTNGTVFAWAKGISTVAAGKHITVVKPMQFKTLEAYATDSNYQNETGYNRLVWWMPASTLTKDVFMLNAAKAGSVDTFSVFWVGHYDKDNTWSDITVDEVPHQTITVTVTDAVSGQKTILTNGYGGVFAKGSSFTVSITPEDGYDAGTLSTTGGTLSGNELITATKATVKLAPETWDYYVYCAAGRSWDYIDGVQSENYGEPFGPKPHVYYIFEAPKSGRYILNCKIWACTGHNHSSSNEGNSYFNIAFKLGDEYLAGTNGDVNGFASPLYGSCGCWSDLSVDSCKEMDFGNSEPIYLTEGVQRVDLWIKLFQVANKHSAIRVHRMLITPTYIGE